MLADPALARDLESVHGTIGRGDRLLAAEGLATTFGRLFRRHGEGGRRLARPPRDAVLVRRVAELMHDRLADDLRLADLAAAAGLTPFQLIGLFNRTTGLSPHAYLTQLRLADARGRLGRGEPIAAAAAYAGFYDQSALTRHFKRAYGITPGQYAEAVGAA
jgi:AraC-like DNA-binding protein